MPRASPASSSNRCSVSTCWDSTITAVPGHRRRISSAACRPSVVWVGGIRMSASTTSGRSAATSCSSCAASPAMPATSRPASVSTRRRPSRSSTASSAMTTRSRPSTGVTKPPGGRPGLQAGQESGALGSGAGKYSRPYGLAPVVFRSHVRYCQGEDGIQVQGVPRPDAAAGAGAHIRLRPAGMEPHPGRPPSPLAPGGQRHVVCGVRPGADRDEEDPAPWCSATRCPAYRCSRRCGTSTERSARSSPGAPATRGSSPAASRQSAHYTRSAFTMRGGELRLAKMSDAAAVRLVLAGCGRDHAGPGDGDRLRVSQTAAGT